MRLTNFQQFTSILGTMSEAEIRLKKTEGIRQFVRGSVAEPSDREDYLEQTFDRSHSQSPLITYLCSAI